MKTKRDIGIKIKTMDSKLHPLNLKQSACVKELKSLIEQKMEIPLMRQRLIFRGKLLKDDSTLDSYDIEEESVIHLVAKPDDPEPSAPITERSASESGPTRNSNQGQEGNPLRFPINLFRLPEPFGSLSNRSNTSGRRILRTRRPRQRVRNNPETLEALRQTLLSIETIASSRIAPEELKQGESANDDINPFDTSTRRSFQVGQWLDAKDTVGDWLEAQITKISDRRCYIHYNGWPNRWDEWIEMGSDRLAVFRTHTSQNSRATLHVPMTQTTADADLERNPARSRAENSDEDQSGENNNRSQIVNSTERETNPLGMLAEISHSLSTLQNMLREVNNGSNLSTLSSSTTTITTIGQTDNENKSNIINDVQILQAVQLAPILDRMGRLLTDYAPLLTILGEEEDTESQVTSRPDPNSARENVRNDVGSQATGTQAPASTSGNRPSNQSNRIPGLPGFMSQLLPSFPFVTNSNNNPSSSNRSRASPSALANLFGGGRGNQTRSETARTNASTSATSHPVNLTDISTAVTSSSSPSTTPPNNHPRHTSSPNPTNDPPGSKQRIKRRKMNRDQIPLMPGPDDLARRNLRGPRDNLVDIHIHAIVTPQNNTTTATTTAAADTTGVNSSNAAAAGGGGEGEGEGVRVGSHDKAVGTDEIEELSGFGGSDGGPSTLS
mmetsp:Transcript_36145/g.41158  ORF Transcript_36145/g.41158 Transcript_36145/m.41158 type:complete len:670 (+) Transcript_36145:136-2145(+)